MWVDGCSFGIKTNNSTINDPKTMKTWTTKALSPKKSCVIIVIKNKKKVKMYKMVVNGLLCWIVQVVLVQSQHGWKDGWGHFLFHMSSYVFVCVFKGLFHFSHREPKLPLRQDVVKTWGRWALSMAKGVFSGHWPAVRTNNALPPILYTPHRTWGHCAVHGLRKHANLHKKPLNSIEEDWKRPHTPPVVSFTKSEGTG